MVHTRSHFGSLVLGLDDLGLHGIGIVIGKLDFYVAAHLAAIPLVQVLDPCS